VRFLKHLMHQIPGKQLVIWDGSPMHRSREVKDFLASGASLRLQLEQLPGYAAELNPDEGIWKHLKCVELKNLCCQSLAQLSVELRILFCSAYVIYVGGDMFPSYRFFVPVVPVLWALAFVTVQDLPTPRVHRLAIGVLCLLSVPSIVWTYPSLLVPSSMESGNARIGLYLKENTPPEAVVADSWAGSVFHFSRRPGVDLLGKTDPYIARQAPAYNGTIPGHNKFDYSYSLDERQPDYVVSSFLLPVTEEDMQEMSTSDFAYIGLLYFHPSFQEHCLPNPLNTDTWRTIFRCDWSPGSG
jgi:DDE superfamily endonuclease